MQVRRLARVALLAPTDVNLFGRIFTPAAVVHDTAAVKDKAEHPSIVHGGNRAVSRALQADSHATVDSRSVGHSSFGASQVPLRGGTRPFDSKSHCRFGNVADPYDGPPAAQQVSTDGCCFKRLEETGAGQHTPALASCSYVSDCQGTVPGKATALGPFGHHSLHVF